jgi:cytochrome b
MSTKSASIPASVPPAKSLLWDWQVRIGHWLMVILVIACWWTAENHHIDYHRYCAYALLGIVLFRIYWGFFGSSTARFTQFLQSPSAVFRYIKNLPQRDALATPGHNALGGYSALLLWFLLLVQISLGLFAIDVDGFEGGPFADYLSFNVSRAITEWHEITFNVLLGFIALHIIAVIYYLLWRRQSLTATMIHGKTDVPMKMPIQLASGARFIVGLIIVALILLLIIG